MFPHVSSNGKGILLLGDLHKKYPLLKQYVKNYNPAVIIQVGDFGYFPELISNFRFLKDIDSAKCPIYFIDGNHENFLELEKLNKKTTNKYKQVSDYLYYIPRGTTEEISDGRKILFMGGAITPEWGRGPYMIEFFPNHECIQSSDMYTLKDEQIDIVISHTAPIDWTHQILQADQVKVNDWSERALSTILYKYKPKLWYHGHFHIGTKNIFEMTNTKWFSLEACQTKYPGTEVRWLDEA